MPRLPGPLDVDYASVGNQRRVVAVPADQSGANLARVGEATAAILNRVRDQQIENDVADASLKMREGLDKLHAEFETDSGDPATYGARWEERARALEAEQTQRLTSPAHQRLWRQWSNETLGRARQGITQLTQRRQVEAARGGFLTLVGESRRIMADENQTPEARAQALTTLETMTARAVQRRTIGADDGARYVQEARDLQARFEQEIGMRQQAQAAEDSIWAQSGGNLEVALEAARDLDGTLRDDVEDRLVTRASRERTARAVALDDAMGRAYQVAEENGSLEGIDPADRAVITQAGQMDTLRTYLRNRAGGASGSDWTQMTRQSQLRRDTLMGMAAEDDGAPWFAGLDLDAPMDAQTAAALGAEEGSSVRALVTPEDFNALRKRQRELRGEVPADGNNTIVDQAYMTMWRVAEPMANAQGGFIAGRDRGGNRGEASDRRRERENALRAAIWEAAAGFVREHSRPPRPDEVESAISQHVVRALRGGAQQDAQASGQDWVTFEDMTTGERLAIYDSFRRRGQEPTTEDIEREYNNFLASQ